jgi:hypothetical protein
MKDTTIHLDSLHAQFSPFSPATSALRLYIMVPAPIYCRDFKITGRLNHFLHSSLLPAFACAFPAFHSSNIYFDCYYYNRLSPFKVSNILSMGNAASCMRPIALVSESESYSLHPPFPSITMPSSSSRQPSPLREPIDPEAAGAIAAGRVAVITGAASGIGRAAALELAQ